MKMRCKFCGSTALHNDTAHQTFSGGKAVAGAVALGVVGAAAGFIGKEKKGYRCASCGQFMSVPMDFMTESKINSAIRDAESGRSTYLFDYYKRQYPNISANIPAQPVSGVAASTAGAPAYLRVAAPKAAGEEAAESNVKTRFACRQWQPDCPVFVKEIIVRSGSGSDMVSLNAVNMSRKALRSAYINAVAYDDTGDKLSECRCVYQQLSVEPGMPLPIEKKFLLGTDAAYRVELNVEKASFVDDSIWREEGEARRFALPELIELNAENFARFRYIKTKHAASANGSPVYMPGEFDGFWLCDCGLPVLKGEKCPHCGEDYEEVMAAFDQKNLIAAQIENVKQRAKKRSDAVLPIYNRACAEELERKEKLYNEALALSGSEVAADLRNAEGKFASLGAYKDSARRAEDCANRAVPLEKLIEQQQQQALQQRQQAEQQTASNAATSALIIAIISLVCSATLFLSFVGLILSFLAMGKSGAAAKAGPASPKKKVARILAIIALPVSIVCMIMLIGVLTSTAGKDFISNIFS